MCSFNFSVYAVSLFPNLSKNFLVVIKSANSFITLRLFVTDVNLSLFFFYFRTVVLSVPSRCFRGCKGKQVFVSNKCL